MFNYVFVNAWFNKIYSYIKLPLYNQIEEIFHYISYIYIYITYTLSLLFYFIFKVINGNQTQNWTGRKYFILYLAAVFLNMFCSYNGSFSGRRVKGGFHISQKPAALKPKQEAQN